MSKKGIPPPKLAPGVATPKEVEDAFKKLGLDIKNSFGIKIKKPKNARQNQSQSQSQAAPGSTSSHLFPPPEQNDNDFNEWVPSQEHLNASHSDLLPVEVWEDYEHLLNEGNLEIDTADSHPEWEDHEFLTDSANSVEDGHTSIDELSLQLGRMGDKELEEYLSLADLATSSPPPSSCIDGHTDTDSSSLKMKHIKESDLHQSDLEGTDDKAKEAANIMEVEIDEHGWQKLHPAPPPLVMTEEERLRMQGGYEFVHQVPGPDDVAYEDDTISELGASVAPEDGTVVLGDSAEVIVLREEVERVRAENALLRRNYS